ncbi:hypothetical protein [Bacillus solitudinis]|uniref:hypothetical protein n=1 Tax=Bacillus solitudinis TaxID=2014074 RepID=UPI0012FD278C|nr:hypothetical protein [Bacillus solitudinis]
MSNKLPEPFQTYWNGKQLHSKMKEGTIHSKSEGQDELWIDLRKTIEEAAQKLWGN